MQLILTLLVWQSNPMVFRGLLGFCIVPPMWLRKHNLLWHGEPGAKTLELFVCVNHSLQPNPTLLHDVLWEVYEKPWHWGNSPLSNTCSRHLTVCVFTFEKRKIRWELESVYCKGGKRSNWNLLDWRFRVFLQDLCFRFLCIAVPNRSRHTPGSPVPWKGRLWIDVEKC